MRKHIRKTVTLLILSFTLLFLAAACAPAPVQPPPGWSEDGQPHYPFNDDKVLDFVGMPLASIETEQGAVIFNEITDIEAYRAFNTAYGYQNQPYYSTRTTGLDLLTEHPVHSESDFLDVSAVCQDGHIESRKPLDSFLTYGEKAPAAAALVTKILENKLAPDVRACYHGGPDASGFKFYPESNCVATVVIAKDLTAIDERFTHILPIFQQTLGTENSSIIGEQEIAVHHFYQNRLYNESETEEAFQYYAYYEKDGLQYLYQFSSNWALTGQSTGALHNPPAVLYRTNTQEECREEHGQDHHGQYDDSGRQEG